MKVHLFAMRTWGELGNLLAAKTLASCLAEADRSELELDVEVFEAERFLPRFAAYGDQIAAIIKDRTLAVAARVERYHELMGSIGEVFYPGFEGAETVRGPLAEELEPWVEHFRSRPPDLAIGTKGVISRCLYAAASRAAVPPEVANFVTNEGLLSLPIHRSPAIRHHLVPFESGRRILIEDHGYPPDRVRVVGRLIAHAHVSSVGAQPLAPVLPAAVPEVAQTRRRLLVFSNRGGPAFLDVLRTVAASGTEPSVLFIAYNDPALAASARALQGELGVAHWRIVERLGQGDYIKSIRWLADGEFPLLLSKTGPNTMLEATYFGIPQLLLASGLPAEQWVGDFVEEHGFGRAFTAMERLCATLREWLREPREIATRRRIAEGFSRKLMHQETVAGAIRSEIGALLGAPVTP